MWEPSVIEISLPSFQDTQVSCTVLVTDSHCGVGNVLDRFLAAVSMVFRCFQCFSGFAMPKAFAWVMVVVLDTDRSASAMKHFQILFDK